MNPYDPAVLKRFHLACVSARGSRARGVALEDFAEHVFATIPSVNLYKRNVKDAGGIQEIDLVFSHFFTISGLPINDVTIVVECKNEKTKTSSSQIQWFASKLQTRSLNVGVLVTSAGISGNPARQTAGYGAIRDALAGGTAIIVVTTLELAALESSDDFVQLMRGRLMELRTYRSYLSI